MQLRDPGLLLHLVGLPIDSIDRVLSQQLNIYSRATSSEGLLCIRKYWDSHCATLGKLPALALVDQGSCPRGLPSTEFAGLLSRLTNLKTWQIWDLWSTLDVYSCGFVGCPEFSLLVVLLCAAVSQQQLQAVHAYAQAITRVFTGAHVASSFRGLHQCCQLLGLPTAGLQPACQQLLLAASSRDSNATGCKDKNSGCTCCSSSSCHGPSNSDTKSSILADNPKQCSPLQETAAAATETCKTLLSTDLGCCCSTQPSSAGNHSPKKQQQWACGAMAHKAYCASLAAATAAQQLKSYRCTDVQCTTLLLVQDVQLVLFQLAHNYTNWQNGVREDLPAEEELIGCWGCTIS